MDLRCLGNVVVISQFKGGVGKTSLVVNVGGLLAAAGKRVLLVDLDGQAHCSPSLGVERGTGRALFDSLVSLDPPVILKSVRPGLDLIAGGTRTYEAAKVLTSSAKYRDAFLAMLTPIAHEYDIIFLDTPPGNYDLVEGALSIAGALVAPQDRDWGTLETMRELHARFMAASSVNPDLRLLGVIMFAFGAGSSRIRQDMRDGICQLFGADPLVAAELAAQGGPYDIAHEPAFRASIRYSESAGNLARKDNGRLVQELADDASNASGLWRDHLKLGSKAGRFATNADGLLDDYIAVSRELVERFTTVRAAAQKESVA